MDKPMLLEVFCKGQGHVVRVKVTSCACLFHTRVKLHASAKSGRDGPDEPDVHAAGTDRLT